MAILHFDLEIDSEVYPELYARLASLSRTPARAEKLRQLAATGLLWEMARLHGPALADLLADLGGELPPSPDDATVAPGLAPDAHTATASADFGEEVVAQVPIPTAQVLDHPDASTAAAPTVAAPPARSSLGERAAPPASFVDLALDVAPASGRAPEVPTLVDEVPPSLLHEVPAVTMAMVVPIRGSEATLAASNEHDEPRESTVRRPASRERLKRMRDRGLFQNG